MALQCALTHPSRTRAADKASGARATNPMRWATLSDGERDASERTAAPTHASRPTGSGVTWHFATFPIVPTSAVQIQPRLRIGAVDDPLEREADAVVDPVMRMPTAEAAAGSISSSTSAGLQRKGECGDTCPQCQEELSGSGGGTLQMKSTAADKQAGMPAPASVHEALRSPGEPLDPATRTFMERRFGHDFSQVRVHTAGAADGSARDIGADAYTAGHNIVFAGGHYAPSQPSGRRLIAHELAHVLQQSGGMGQPSFV